MITHYNVLETVYNYFKNIPELANIKFLYEFPAQKQDLPLRSPIVTIGLDEYKMAPIEDAELVTSTDALNTATVKMLICVPKAQSGFDCYCTLKSILNNSKEFINSNKVLNIKTDSMRFDSTVCGLVLPFYISLKLDSAYIEL